MCWKCGKIPRRAHRSQRKSKQVMHEADIFPGSSPVTRGDVYKTVKAGWLKEVFTAAPVNTQAHLLDEAVDWFDRVYIDDRDMHEFCRGPGIIKTCAPPPELAGLLTGRAVGKRSQQERIIPFAWGISLNDVACGRRIINAALEKGVGVMRPL